jgi:hypothetical protein
VRRFLRILGREPLVHFLALGGVIFAANAILHPSVRTDDHRIEITRADVARIRSLYAQQWGAEPRDAETGRLVEDYVRAEILFREGTALGLDAEDSVLRNRVIQKMEFLILDPAAGSEPSEPEIAAYFAAHRDAYRIPEAVAFRQIYFSRSSRGDRVDADAQAMLIRLRTGSATDADRGDPSMLPDAPEPRSRAEIEKDFGPEFSSAVFALPIGGWEGPVQSTIGLHLVQVTEHVPARMPALAELRQRVRGDMMEERQQKAAEAGFDQIRSRYRIVIDPDALRPAPGSVAASEPR